MWEFVDHIIYINLDHREDRRDHMKTVFESGKIPLEKVTRFSAIHYSPGIVGCAKSHIEVLKMAKKNGWSNILVLEDDIQWREFDKNYKNLLNLLDKKFDVLLLSGMYLDTSGHRVFKSFTTGAYIVKSHYYDTLIQCFEESLVKLLAPPKLSFLRIDRKKQIMNNHDYHFDVYWSKLQKRDTFLGVIPSMLTQIESHSDILNTTYKQTII